MDQRTIDVIIKVSEDGLGAVTAKLTGLTQGIMGLQVPLPWLGQQSLLLVAAFAALLTPLAGFIVGLSAMTVVASVATGGMLALVGAVFMLGAANAGGLNPAAEMIKTQKALEAAVKEHTAALTELQQVQAGGGAALYGSGLSQAQMLNIARTYVGVTAGAVADAQKNLAEPMSGLNGPIAALGTALDTLHDHLEVLARPLADHIALWALGFVPTLQKAGEAIFQWLGPRQNDMLDFLGRTVRVVGDGFTELAKTIGKTVDFVLANKPMFIAFFEAVTGAVVGLVNGIINVSLAIVNWIQQNPAMVTSLKTLVEAGVNFVSRAIQGLVELINGPTANALTGSDGLEMRTERVRVKHDDLATAITNVSTGITTFLNSKSTKDFMNFWSGLATAIDNVNQKLTDFSNSGFGKLLLHPDQGPGSNFNGSNTLGNFFGNNPLWNYGQGKASKRVG